MNFGFRETSVFHLAIEPSAPLVLEMGPSLAQLAVERALLVVALLRPLNACGFWFFFAGRGLKAIFLSAPRTTSISSVVLKHPILIRTVPRGNVPMVL